MVISKYVTCTGKKQKNLLQLGDFFIIFFKLLAYSFQICYSIYCCYRGVAQLVARVVWDHEAAGSIPVTSTKRKIFLKDLKQLGFRSFVLSKF